MFLKSFQPNFEMKKNPIFLLIKVDDDDDSKMNYNRKKRLKFNFFQNVT